MATIAELRQQAATIKNATQVGENTANRVGTTFETVADLLDEEGGGGTGNLAFVDINDIDDIGNTSDMLAENPNIYTVTKTTGNTTTKVGTLIVFVNTNRYVLMQVLVSGYILNADGTLDTGGSDFTAKILWRGKWFNGTPPAGTSIGEWSSWLYLSGGGGGGDIDIDPYPISGSDNAVASGGVFDAIAAASTRKVNLNDIDSIGTYSDMLADVPTFYSVVETIGNNTFRTGTLMVFANSNRYVILQVLVSGYITNEDGTQIAGSDFAAKILWRGKWFNGTPPAGTNIGEWSPWSSLSGGGGVDAYTKTETDALLARKQNVLTFDDTPTSGSTNPVTSGGVKTALDAKADQSTTYTKTEVDTTMATKANVAALAGYTPTANFATINGASITGGGDVIITAGSSSITTIDATPTSGSTNPVQSGGVYDAIEGGFYY